MVQSIKEVGSSHDTACLVVTHFREGEVDVQRLFVCLLALDSRLLLLLGHRLLPMLEVDGGRRQMDLGLGRIDAVVGRVVTVIKRRIKQRRMLCKVTEKQPRT